MSTSISRGMIFEFMKGFLKQIDLTRQHKSGGGFSFHDMMRTIVSRLVKEGHLKSPAGLGPYLNYVDLGMKEGPLILMLNDCFWQLIVRGIIIPEPAPPRFLDHILSWDQFLITEYGARWVHDESRPIPEDIAGFMDYLRKVPDCDGVILKYINESLRTFDGGFLFASAVMLGCAAEKLFYLLAEALEESLEDQAEKQSLSDKLKERRLFKLWEEVRGIFERHSVGRAKQILQANLASLLSLFEVIRLQRNDAGHPAIGSVDPTALYVYLSSFPPVCRRTYELIGWLRAKKI